MTTKKRFVGLCLLYCFSLPSSSVSGQQNPRSKRIRNITNTPGIFLRQKGNRNELEGNRLLPLSASKAQAPSSQHLRGIRVCPAPARDTPLRIDEAGRDHARSHTGLGGRVRAARCSSQSLQDIAPSDSVSRALKTSKMTLPRIYIGENTATKVSVSWSIDFSKVKAVFLTYVCNRPNRAV